MNSDCEKHQRAILEGRGSAENAEHCHDCRSLFAVERILESVRSFPVAEPPRALVAGTLGKLSSRLERQASERQRITWRLILAGAFSFPVILTVNAVVLATVYGLLERLLPSVAATTATAFIASSLLMSVSLAYAALPLLASFGFRLREGF